MSKQLGITDTVENVLAKLFVLRNSCVNMLHTDKADPDSIWLQGAESTLTLQTCAEAKRASVRQMWLRTASGRPKRT